MVTGKRRRVVKNIPPKKCTLNVGYLRTREKTGEEGRRWSKRVKDAKKTTNNQEHNRIQMHLKTLKQPLYSPVKLFANTMCELRQFSQTKV